MYFSRRKHGKNIRTTSLSFSLRGSFLLHSWRSTDFLYWFWYWGWSWGWSFFYLRSLSLLRGIGVRGFLFALLFLLFFVFVTLKIKNSIIQDCIKANSNKFLSPPNCSENLRLPFFFFFKTENLNFSNRKIIVTNL